MCYVVFVSLHVKLLCTIILKKYTNFHLCIVHAERLARPPCLVQGGAAHIQKEMLVKDEVRYGLNILSFVKACSGGAMGGLNGIPEL